VTADSVGIHEVARNAIQNAVIGLEIDAPEPGAANVGKTRAELKARDCPGSQEKYRFSGC
jgi:hypothetical protein